MNILEQIEKNELNFLKYDQLVKVLAELNNSKYEKMKLEVDKLLLEGKLVNTSKKKIATAKKCGILEGTITITKKGYGFFIPDDKSVPDIFVSVDNLNGAMHNDRVVVQQSYPKEGVKQDGKVLKVLSHGLNVCVGKVETITTNFAIIVPDNKRVNKITVRTDHLLGAKKDDKVVVKLTKYNAKMPEGKVIEVLLSDNPINVDVLSIIREFELYEEFPKEVLVAADKVPNELRPEDYKGREDLRGLNTFTIDGEDARDFDDAISIETLEDGCVLLGVHIADVGHYVKFEGTLDREAFKRGTSTYFPNAVFPMIPKQLSNGICSLNEKVDRLTLSCFMKIDKHGQVLSHKICEGVINSKARLTYTKATKMLEGDEELCKQYDFIVDDLKKMEQLALKLEKVRNNRGSLNFEIPEPKIILDENLEIERFEKRPNTISDRIIESFMLIANETVAKEFCERKLPFVYRVHDKPDSEKLENFADFASAFGLKFKGDFENIPTKKLQQFIDSIPEENKTVVNKVLLRSMQKAKYDSECLGHYGLGAEFYCHFTSPIRRYPDLTIHRIIKEYLHKELTQDRIKRLKTFVGQSAVQSSQREAISDKAEILVDEYFKARYMKKLEGEVFEGIISGVTDRGLFVELSNTCEGFISVYNLPDKFYNYLDTKLMLAGPSSQFRIGDKIKIKVDKVDLESRKVDFIYIDPKRKNKKNCEEELSYENNSKQ